MMGAESVAYHEATVLGRGDDHPGAALDYYGSRGETPLRWGGRGTRLLGLSGPVESRDYKAIYGPGGAADPDTRVRLANTKRPGMELVVSAHKSVAEIGVIGRADDMHAILDAERDATLEYLEQLVCERGGRRGRAATPTPTGGLVYAHTRHATTRAGDPGPHDHVLIANVSAMLDERGGWKAAHTALIREHVHAATAAGRMAAARKAIELGYGIVSDDGPSGKLRHWAIAGVAQQVVDLHSKRSDEIDDALDEAGFDSYRARGIAARTSRSAKRFEAVDDLVPRWRQELTDIGWHPDRIIESIRNADSRRIAPEALHPADVRAIVDHLLGPDGPLAAQKVFSRRDSTLPLRARSRRARPRGRRRPRSWRRHPPRRPTRRRRAALRPGVRPRHRDGHRPEHRTRRHASRRPVRIDGARDRRPRPEGGCAPTPADIGPSALPSKRSAPADVAST